MPKMGTFSVHLIFVLNVTCLFYCALNNCSHRCKFLFIFVLNAANFHRVRTLCRFRSFAFSLLNCGLWRLIKSLRMLAHTTLTRHGLRSCCRGMNSVSSFFYMEFQESDKAPGSWHMRVVCVNYWVDCTLMVFSIQIGTCKWYVNDEPVVGVKKTSTFLRGIGFKIRLNTSSNICLGMSFLRMNALCPSLLLYAWCSLYHVFEVKEIQLDYLKWKRCLKESS